MDVLVSEWMGYALLFESMLGSVLYARDRWLRPGGAVLPDVARVYLAAGSEGASGLNFWRNVYGFRWVGWVGAGGARGRWECGFDGMRLPARTSLHALPGRLPGCAPACPANQTSLPPPPAAAPHSMESVRESLMSDALRRAIVRPVLAQHVISEPTCVQSFDLATMKVS